MAPQPLITPALSAELAEQGIGDTALGRVALRLAQTLDDGAGLSTAAVARELRACLDALKTNSEGDRELDGFLAGLRAPVRDSQD